MLPACVQIVQTCNGMILNTTARHRHHDNLSDLC